MEENQPPSKKLKQATLSFFKTTQEKPTLKLSSLPSHGKKRRNSNSSESPSKSAKLSKTSKVLINSDSSNVKSSKSDTKDLDVQEVSSSSEAESLSAGKSNTGRCCLMERFLTKKTLNDSQQEITSTIVDLDSSLDNAANVSVKSKNDVSPDSVDLSDEDDDGKNADDDKNLGSDCDETDKIKSANPVEGKTCKIGDGETDAMTNINTVELETCKNGDSLEQQSVLCEKKFSTELNQDNVEEDPGKTLETSVSDTSIMKPVTSTPLKPNTSLKEKSEATPSQSILQSPVTPGTSGKKTGRKVDPIRKAEKEAIKEKLRLEKETQRLERKRKLDEAKSEKEKERKEKREAKEKERQELKEKQDQEKLEKEKVKEETRQKKEEERLRKEEEKQKKMSALEEKQEEKRKKEDEKKRKEEEKLKEEELKNKKEEKLKNSFKSFFKKQAECASKMTPAKTSSGLFIPFELKKDMHLAPTLRREALSEDKMLNLDEFLSSEDALADDSSYLNQLQNGSVKPHHTGRILRKNPQPADEMDLEVIHDSEALKKVFHKVKLLQFHTDHRPPYYGTWRKDTKLSPKDPFKKDEDIFDYEVDSDDEWEEEEPGESLSCSDGEDDKEENEDEEEDGWMVPHGYLSEDEGCNEDDEITPEKLKLQQQARAKAWEEEQKRKLHASPMVVIGCFFENSPSEKMAGDIRLLYQYKAVVLMPDTPIATALAGNLDTDKVDEPVADASQVTPTPKGPKKQSVPDEAMPDLIRLVHGNRCGLKKLVKEFRVFWLGKCNSSVSENSVLSEPCLDESLKDVQMDTSLRNDSVCEALDSSKVFDELCENGLDSADKSKEEGHGCEISKRQLEKKIMAMAVREKRPNCKKISWYVHDSVLAEFSMSNIELPNNWEYLTSGPTKSPTANPQTSTSIKAPVDGTKVEAASDLVTQTPKDQRSIMDFALSKKELDEKSESTMISNPPASSDTAAKQKDASKETVDSQNRKSGGQRSIFDFALSKKEAGKTCGVKAAKNTSDSSLIISSEEPLNDSNLQEKKGNNQRSIMDFAKPNKGVVKGDASQCPLNSSNIRQCLKDFAEGINSAQTTVPDKTNGVSSGESVEVIEIDDEDSHPSESVNDHGEVSTTTNCPEKAAPVS